MPQSLTQIRTTIKDTYNNPSKYFLNFAKLLKNKTFSSVEFTTKQPITSYQTP